MRSSPLSLSIPLNGFGVMGGAGQAEVPVAFNSIEWIPGDCAVPACIVEDILSIPLNGFICEWTMRKRHNIGPFDFQFH